MKKWFDIPIGSRRGTVIFWGLIAVVVAGLLGFVAIGFTWSTKQNIAKATAPWSEYSVVKMVLKPLPNSDQIEIRLESGYRREQMVLKTIETIEKKGIVEATARSKYFTLPVGETTICLPVSPGWTKVRVILSFNSTYADQLTIEAELTRESQ